MSGDEVFTASLATDGVCAALLEKVGPSETSLGVRGGLASGVAISSDPSLSSASVKATPKLIDRSIASCASVSLRALLLVLLVPLLEEEELLRNPDAMRVDNLLDILLLFPCAVAVVCVCASSVEGNVEVVLEEEGKGVGVKLALDTPEDEEEDEDDETEEVELVDAKLKIRERIGPLTLLLPLSPPAASGIVELLEAVLCVAVDNSGVEIGVGVLSSLFCLDELISSSIEGLVLRFAL